MTWQGGVEVGVAEQQRAPVPAVAQAPGGDQLVDAALGPAQVRGGLLDCQVGLRGGGDALGEAIGHALGQGIEQGIGHREAQWVRRPRRAHRSASGVQRRATVAPGVALPQERRGQASRPFAPHQRGAALGAGLAGHRALPHFPHPSLDADHGRSQRQRAGRAMRRKLATIW